MRASSVGRLLMKMLAFLSALCRLKYALTLIVFLMKTASLNLLRASSAESGCAKVMYACPLDFSRDKGGRGTRGFVLSNFETLNLSDFLELPVEVILGNSLKK